MNQLVTAIGIIAAICTTASFVPQVIKTLKTRQTKDISLSMYVIFTLGLVSWLIYGIALKDVPIILANTLTLALTFIIIFLKVKHG